MRASESLDYTVYYIIFGNMWMYVILYVFMKMLIVRINLDKFTQSLK